MRRALSFALGSTVYATSAIAQSASPVTTTGNSEQAASSAGGDAVSADDIVVTAQRREENAQDVPVAVQAISSKQLGDNGIGRIKDISLVAPQITVADAGGYIIPYVRGVGNLVFGNGTYGSVATYVDDVYIARLTGLQLDLDTVANVQILSGPQGALYGRNATGGAIVITTTTPQPGDPLSGKAEVSVGNYSTRAIRGAVSGSLGSTLAIGIDASKNDRDGFVKNLNPPGAGLHTNDLDDQDSYSVAAVVNWRPTEELSFIARASQSGLNDRGSSAFQQAGNAVFPGIFPGLNSGQTAVAGTVALLTGVPAFGAEAGSRATFSTRPGETFNYLSNGYENGVLTGKHKQGSFQDLKGQRFSLHIGYEFEGFNVLSISATTREKQRSGADILGVNGANIGFTIPLPGGGTVFNPLIGSVGFSGKFSSKTYSQELRFQSDNDSSFNWTAGAVYFNERGNTDLTGDFFGVSARSALNRFGVDSYAAYAQGTLAISDRLSITVGGRYTDETFVLTDRINPADPATFPGTVNVGRRKQSDSKFTYLGRLEYRLDDVLLYGGISTAFKSGNLNAQNPAAGAADPETITAYEGGVKSTISQALELNLAGYYYDYKRIQISLVDQGSGGTFLLNGPSAQIYGLDLSSRLRVSSAVRLTASATLLHTEYRDDAILTPANSPTGTGGLLAIRGNRLAGAPKFAISAGADVSIPLPGGGKVLFAGNVAYNGGYFFEAENRVGTGGTTAKAYTVANLSIGYALPGDRYSIRLYARNAFNDDYYRTGIVAGGTSLAVIAGAPQQYGVTIRAGF